MSQVFLLPYPPSVNNLFATRRIKGKIRRVLSKRGREYRAKVIAACGVCKPLVGTVFVKIDIHPPNKRRADLDNTLKAILDGLKTAGVYLDDSQVGHIDVLRCPIIPKGRAVVEVSEYEPA